MATGTKAKPNNAVLAALAAAPIDDEPVTETERRDIARSREEFASGKGVPHAAAKKLLEIP